MSKIGVNPIEVPNTVSVEIIGKKVTIKGVTGEYVIDFPAKLKVVKDGTKLLVSRSNEDKKTKSLHGLYRQLVYNIVTGLVKPWQKRLEVVGTGFTVKLQGEDLIFKLGYSHQITFKKVPGITFQVEGNNKVVVSGVDKQLVGQTAYQIKMLKKPDAYKGKGVRFEGEVIKLKPGKKVKTTAGVGAA